MAQMIFVNLPVKDLQKSMHFFSQLGYTFNKQFTDEKAACMVISDTIYAMLITEPFFQTFIPGKVISDTATAKEVLVCLSADSREAVDSLLDKAVAAGANIFRAPEDHGFMYGRSFEDIDGHVWEVMWMDPAAVVQQEQGESVTAEA
jgi:predicted lactoylglutathione lyase